MLLVAGLLAAAPAGPDAPLRVHVVGDEDWLVGRLLEEGFAVTGGADAQIDLTITRSDRDWQLAAEGETREQLAVPIDGDEGVARLELLHLAVGALDTVQPRAPASPAVQSFAIELASVFAPVVHDAVETELAHAVLDSGAALAPTRRSASFVLCAALADGAVVVAVRGADEPCPMPDAEATTASVREQAHEVVSAVLLGAPTPEPTPVPPARDDERAPLARTDAPIHAPRRTWKNAPLVVRGGAAVGVIGRGREADAVLAASLFIGREPGLSAWLDLQAWPVARARDALFVLEVLPAAGLRIRALSRGRVALDLGGLFGVQAHGYRFDVGQQRSSGIAFDVSGEGAIGLAIRLWRAHELQLLFRTGRSSRDRRHTVEGQTLWYRTTWRVGATIGLTFGKQVRR